MRKSAWIGLGILAAGLAIVLSLSTSLASADTVYELNWHKIVIKAPAWHRHLADNDRGLTIWQQTLRDRAPFLRQTVSPHSRLFGMIKVPLIEYSKVKFADPYQGSALLVRVYLRVLVFDVERQQEVWRETISGCQALPVNQWQQDCHLVLVEEALRNCVPLVTEALTMRLGLKKEAARSEVTEQVALQKSLSRRRLPDFHKIPLTPGEAVPAEKLPFRMPWEWIGGLVLLVATLLAWVRLRHKSGINLDTIHTTDTKKTARPGQVPDFVRRSK